MVGTVHDALYRAAQRGVDRVAIVAGDESWTFAEVHGLSNAAAHRLAALGVGKGDRVAVMTSNRPEFVFVVHAISSLGAASVLLSPAWKQWEVAHAIGLTAPAWGIADGEAAGLLIGALGPGRVLDLDDRPTLDALLSGGRHPVQARPVDVHDDVVLVFSSGTVGLPKAVRHTHASMHHAVRHWRDALGLGPSDRFQVATPPSHILGLLNLLTAIEAGAWVRLHRRFDLDEVLHRIETDRITLEMAVAPIALAWANHPDLERHDLSSLRYIMWGATPVTASVAETVTRRTGVRWLPAYGASEVPVIAANTVADPAGWRLDSVGPPPGGVTVRIVDLDDGSVRAPGEHGEVQTSSPSTMAGYLPAEANEDAFADGWYRTGDVGWVDAAGWIHLTDRSKEMIKVNGFQVAPAEIEAVLHRHAAVLDCAVFGVPDERAGEVPVAAVAVDPAATVSAGELQDFVATSLAAYKQVRDVMFVARIPRLASGKALRRTLREQWLAEAAI